MEKSESNTGADNVERLLASLNVHAHFEMTKTLHWPGDDKRSNTSSNPMLLNEYLESFIHKHPEHVDRIIFYCKDRPIGEFGEDLAPLMEYLGTTPPLSAGAL